MQLRPSISVLALLIAAAPAAAHFPFIVLESTGNRATVVMSESLAPDPEVKIELLENIKLAVRGSNGEESPISLERGDHCMTFALNGSGTRIIHGVADLGIMKRGDKPAHHLVYYPKTIVGNAFDAKAVGDTAPVELVPVRAENKLKLQLLVAGKPAAEHEVVVILPDGIEQRSNTDVNGFTESFDQIGRFGAWARHWTDTAGEIDGKPFAQVREYATLVFDISKNVSAVQPAATKNESVAFATLPQAAASFGAITLDGWLYVYGGHISERHEYSVDSVSGAFNRMSLSDPTKWETLEAGPAVQGMNLATDGKYVYRVGGMQPRNSADQDADNFSIAEVARFDPATGKWESLPSLPTPRSSHDVAIVDGKLFVIGGWNMRGKDLDSEWTDRMDVLDLNASSLEWKSVEQPFSRRALIVATLGKRIFTMGGFDAQSKPQLNVMEFDTQTMKWTAGPNIPGKPFNGFSPAACAADGSLYLSVASGDVFRLSAAGDQWTSFATNSPRIVHRLVSAGDKLLVVGGASNKTMLDRIDAIAIHPAVSVNETRD